MITLVLLPGANGTGIFSEGFAAALQPYFQASHRQGSE
jgi:hypothetical protein